MASADFLPFVVTAHFFFDYVYPNLRRQDLPGYSHVLSLFTCRIYRTQSVQLLGFVLRSKLALVFGLICGFCSSGQSFAHQGTFQPLKSGFLQIPLHNGHPCLWLSLPATGRLRDFHPRERALTGRTKIDLKPLAQGLFRIFRLPFSG